MTKAPWFHEFCPHKPKCAGVFECNQLKRLASGANNAQPCGCDPGAGWVCERHQEETPRRLA